MESSPTKKKKVLKKKTCAEICKSLLEIRKISSLIYLSGVLAIAAVGITFSIMMYLNTYISGLDEFKFFTLGLVYLILNSHIIIIPKDLTDNEWRVLFQYMEFLVGIPICYLCK